MLVVSHLGAPPLGTLGKTESFRAPHEYTSVLQGTGTKLQPQSHLGTLVVSDILRIDNLWQFENLQKLQLNNNIIERIEGLENLTHLVWLGKDWLCVCLLLKVAHCQGHPSPPCRIIAVTLSHQPVSPGTTEMLCQLGARK